MVNKKKFILKRHVKDFKSLQNVKKDKSLLVSWLLLKAMILATIFVIVGFNYMLSAVQTKGQSDFWYLPQMTLDQVKRAYNGISDVDKFDSNGYTALMNAVSAGKKDDVKFLIEKGANVNLLSKNPDGNAPLHLAVQRTDSEIIDILIKNYANPLIKNNLNQVPIIAFASMQVYGTSKASGDKDSSKEVKVSSASVDSFKKALNVFVSHGVDLNFPAFNGKPLLFAVVEFAGRDVLNVLQNNYAHLIDFDFKYKKNKNDSGVSISRFAEGFGDIRTYVKPVYFNRQDYNYNSYDRRYSLDDNFTYIIVSAIKGKVDYLNDAIKRGNVNFNLPDKIFGGTCLHWACLYNRVEPISVIVKNGADVNYKSKTGLAPIHCLWGIRETEDKKKVAKILFDFGADFNAKDVNGNTLLHRAVLWADKDYVKLIAQDEDFYRRINFNAKNNFGKIAYDLARELKNKEIEELLNNYKNINYVPEKDKGLGITALMLAAMRSDTQFANEIVKNNKNSVNEKNKDGDTPLHFAVRSRSPELVALFLKNGANANEKNKSGGTAMHELTHVVDKEKRNAIAKSLMEYGAAVMENDKGETIMYMSVRNKMPELISFLKQNFGKMEKNKEGKTAYDLAVELKGKGENMKNILDALDGKAVK